MPAMAHGAFCKPKLTSGQSVNFAPLSLLFPPLCLSNPFAHLKTALARTASPDSASRWDLG